MSLINMRFESIPTTKRPCVVSKAHPTCRARPDNCDASLPPDELWRRRYQFLFTRSMPEDVEGNEWTVQFAKFAAKVPLTPNLTGIALNRIKIKDFTRRGWVSVFNEYKSLGLKTKPSIYANKFRCSIRKRFVIPNGIRRELASKFYQLKMDHEYMKAFPARMKRSESYRYGGEAVQSTKDLLLSCKWFRIERRILKQEAEQDDFTLLFLLHPKRALQLCFTFWKAPR